MNTTGLGVIPSNSAAIIFTGEIYGKTFKH